MIGSKTVTYQIVVTNFSHRLQPITALIVFPTCNIRSAFLTQHKCTINNLALAFLISDVIKKLSETHQRIVVESRSVLNRLSSNR